MHVQKRFFRDIAEDFRVSVGLVSRLARKDGTAHIDGKLASKAAQASAITAVRAAVSDLRQQSGCIASVGSVLRLAQP